MKRTTKRYVITTSAVNCYGYRVLSDGVDFSQYNNNPILTWMHTRADGTNRNQILPLGRVVDIRKEGDAWTGQPEFDDTDSFAMSIYNKYENGTLNMLSLEAQPLQVSDDASLMLPGQTGPTVTRCKVTAISAVDRGGNDEALPVKLSDWMPFALKGDTSYSTSSHTKTTKDIVNNAVAAGKFDQATADKLLALPNDDQSTKTILDVVKSTPINPQLLDGKIHRSLIPLVSKSLGELEMTASGRIHDLKEHAPEVYKAKFFEKNGRLPAERNGKPL